MHREGDRSSATSSSSTPQQAFLLSSRPGASRHSTAPLDFVDATGTASLAATAGAVGSRSSYRCRYRRRRRQLALRHSMKRHRKMSWQTVSKTAIINRKIPWAAVSAPKRTTRGALPVPRGGGRRPPKRYNRISDDRTAVLRRQPAAAFEGEQRKRLARWKIAPKKNVNRQKSFQITINTPYHRKPGNMASQIPYECIVPPHPRRQIQGTPALYSWDAESATLSPRRSFKKNASSSSSQDGLQKGHIRGA